MSGNPYLKRLDKRGNNGHGKLSEKRVAKSMGASLQPNSGAMAGAKSDAQLKEVNFRLEMKSTIDKTLRIEMGWLTKITKEALCAGQTPAVVISFVNPDGSPAMALYSDWVLIPKVKFQEMIDE